MQVSDGLLPPIKSDERLGRRVFSSKDLRRLRASKPVPDIFKPKLGVSDISMDRLDHCSLEDLANIVIATSGQRASNFGGWAALTVSDAVRNNRQVRESAQLDNPYHADIVIPLLGPDEDQEIRNAHAVELAAHASLIEIPC
jgi:hypothetical protein